MSSEYQWRRRHNSREAIFRETLFFLIERTGIFEADESYFGARKVRSEEEEGEQPQERRLFLDFC